MSQLWVQQEVAAGRVKVLKVAGVRNLADILTKHVESETLCNHIKSMDMEGRQDRHSLNPEVATDINEEFDDGKK